MVSVATGTVVFFMFMGDSDLRGTLESTPDMGRLSLRRGSWCDTTGDRVELRSLRALRTSWDIVSMFDWSRSTLAEL